MKIQQKIIYTSIFLGLSLSHSAMAEEKASNFYPIEDPIGAKITTPYSLKSDEIILTENKLEDKKETLTSNDSLQSDENITNDPLEKFNRKVYSFNTAVDNAVIRPIAKGYKTITPEPIRMVVNNVFSNLGDIPVIVNDLLQFRPVQAFKDTSRFVINTTIGFLGMADVAGAMGIKKNPTNFGETLNRWGISSGPYLMLPILGPSTVGDTVGLAVDSNLDVLKNNVDHIRTRNSALGLKMVDKRSNLLDASDILDESAIDPYTAVKDAYFQKKKRRLEEIKN